VELKENVERQEAERQIPLAVENHLVVVLAVRALNVGVAYVRLQSALYKVITLILGVCDIWLFISCSLSLAYFTTLIYIYIYV
jgi:hypothetical protein